MHYIPCTNKALKYKQSKQTSVDAILFPRQDLSMDKLHRVTEITIAIITAIIIAESRSSGGVMVIVVLVVYV